MIVFLSIPIDEERVGEPGLEACEAYDHATVIAKADNESPRCILTPAYVVDMRIGEDISVPTVFCMVHYNALKLYLAQGDVAYDIDTFGDL